MKSLKTSDVETCRMADELARLTGETTMGAVTIALRVQLKRERRNRDATLLAKELHAIGQHCTALLAQEPTAVEHGKLLHDERGLPK